jgi:hypothetical protein
MACTAGGDQKVILCFVVMLEAQTIQTEKDDTQSPKPHQRRKLSVASLWHS